MNLKMPKKIFFVFIFVFQSLSSQNTVGTISITEDAFDGYTLFSTNTKSYLINNCGQVINEWESSFPPGNAVYLLPNGNLLRAGGEDGKSNILFGGQGGIVELFNWEGTVIWSYSFNDNLQRQHHDIYPLENGNILVLIAESWSKDDAILNGRDPSKITEERLYNEKIIEVKPIGNNDIQIVWEWSFNDHLIQDFDFTKLNFGDVSKSPNKLDINFLNGNSTSANWLHINSIQFDSNLNQIILSSRNLSEIFIIDHSTTTEEAATSSGGTYEKGGDILYRWGNPQSYKQGTENDRILFGQHHPHYIPEGFDNEGKIILFNNGNGRDPDYSEVYIINPPETNGVYSYTDNTAYAPEIPSYVYSQFEEGLTSNFYSHIVSGAQVLPNGNILICEGIKGNFFEINKNKEIVWNYKNPISSLNGNTNQGEQVTSNLTFRAQKYAINYEAFIGKTIIPKDPIELNFNLNPCNALNLITLNVSGDLEIYPNPSIGIFKLNKKIQKIIIYNNLGEKVDTFNNVNSINLSHLSSGVYIAKFTNNEKFIVKRLIKN